MIREREEALAEAENAIEDALMVYMMDDNNPYVADGMERAIAVLRGL